MVALNYLDWQRFVGHQLVPTSFVLQNFENDLFTSGAKIDAKSLSSLLENIIMQRCDRMATIGLLGGGGTDSTYALAILTRLGFKNIKVISYRTQNNTASLEFLDDVCSKYNYEHHILTDNKLKLETQYLKFVSAQSRMPRDIAAPVQQSLFQYLNEIGVDLMIDGQYADSVLNMNPQDAFLAVNLKIRKHYFVSATISMAVRSIIEANKVLKNRTIIKNYKKLWYLDSKCSTEMILKLARVESSRRTCALVEEASGRLGISEIYKKLFQNCLLRYREKDKYLLTEIFSPFECLPYNQETKIRKTNLVEAINSTFKLPMKYEKDTSSFNPY